MTANRSMRSLRRAALGAMVSAMAFPALGDEPGSQARLAAVLGPVGAYPLADAELDAYRGTGLLGALAAVIAALPPGYTAVATVNGTTLGNPPGQSTPQSIPPTTIGGTTVSATASNTGATATSTSFTRSSTRTSTRTFSFSRSF
jgi:hypothetical protein